MALLQARARSRAIARLIALFPLTYDLFYAEELAKEGLSPRQPRRHGTRSCYVGGCRLPECCEANAAYLRAKAACRGATVDFWFPERYEMAAAAKTVCAGCPVRDECLEAHLFETEGIYGGFSPKERVKERRRRRNMGTAA